MKKTMLWSVVLSIVLGLGYAQAGVYSDGVYVTDTYGRIGPDLGTPDVGPAYTSTASPPNLYVGGGVLNMETTEWGTEANAKLDSYPTHSQGMWTPTGDVEVMQVDFMVDSIANQQPYQYGPAFKPFSRYPATVGGPAVHITRNADDAVDTFSLHVISFTEYTTIYSDLDGLAFGDDYRLVMKYTDGPSTWVDFYLENLTAGTAQTQWFGMSLIHWDGNAKSDLPDVLSISLGRAIVDMEWDNLKVGQEVPEPASMMLLSLGGLALLRRRK